MIGRARFTYSDRVEYEPRDSDLRLDTRFFEQGEKLI